MANAYLTMGTSDMATWLPDVDVNATVPPSPAPPSTTVMAFKNLVPALVQCFAIILLGYGAGRTRIVCPSQAKGLGLYVTYFALPAMLFKSTVELDFYEVNWTFWLCVLLSKAIVFTLVYGGTLLLGGREALGKAGIYSIFATQSNDFALGYPIVQALYSTSQPDLIKYIYILAPINLIFLNPWAFLSLEFARTSGQGERKTKARLVWTILKRLLANPILGAVFLGVAFNFILSQRLPAVVDGILSSLASSFLAAALFSLGIGMVGKVKQQRGLALVSPALLIACKLLVLPLVTNQLTYALSPGGSNETLTDTFASFGFLYGSLPTAPTVFLFASYYQQSVGLIPPTMVYCTFISAPFMFITATMVMIPMATEGQYHESLSNSAFFVSCVGLASAVWVFMIFVLRKKISQFPHQFTANLIIAQAFGATAVIICHSVDLTTYVPKLFHFMLLLLGVFGARCWTAMVALALFILRYRSTCFVIRYRFLFYIYGWGVPVIVVGILVAVMKLEGDVDVLYEIEKPQLIGSVIVLFLNLIVCAVSLVALHRYDRFRRSGYTPIPGRDVESEDGDGDAPKKDDIQEEEKKGLSIASTSTSTSDITDIEDLPSLNRALQHQMCGSRFSCTRYQANECRQVLLHRNLQEISERDEGDEDVLDESARHQLGRHLILLYALFMSMMIALFLCLWQLIGSNQSGIFLELSFLDTILNYGQGLLLLAIFGLDTENVIMPVVRMTGRSIKPLEKRVRRCVYGTEKVRLPPSDGLSPEVMQTCEQFKRHHLARCQDAIVTDLRYHLRNYRRVFHGSDLVDWLLEVGLAPSRIEATTYAKRLLIGRILEHTHQEHHFHDNKLFFRFLQDEEENGQNEWDIISEENIDNDRLDDSETPSTSR